MRVKGCCYQASIYEVWLPAALRFGISYDSFWHMNPKIIMLYQEEYIRREKKEAEMIDYAAWLSGAYIVNAIQAALFPKKAKYARHAFSLEERENISPEDRFKEWIAVFNKRFDET